MPLSEVMVLNAPSCRLMRWMTLRLSEAVVRSFNLPIRSNPVLRSTRVTMQSLLPVPMTVSISQCPIVAARLDRRGSLRDETFSGQSSTTVIAAVALAAPLAGPSQMGVEQPSRLLVSPDVAVDGLVADGELPQTAEMSGDLLGTPLAAQQLVDLGEVLGREAQVAA